MDYREKLSAISRQENLDQRRPKRFLGSRINRDADLRALELNSCALLTADG